MDVYRLVQDEIDVRSVAVEVARGKSFTYPFELFKGQIGLVQHYESFLLFLKLLHSN